MNALLVGLLLAVAPPAPSAAPGASAASGAAQKQGAAATNGAAPAKAAAPTKAAAKTALFVAEIKADPALTGDALALTTTLCTALGKSKRVEIACAPDVKQLMSFAATAGLMGLDQGTSGKVAQRLEQTTHVVAGTLRKDGGTYVLLLSASVKSGDSQGIVIIPGEALVSLEERADSPKALLGRLDGAAAKLLAPMGAPGPGR